MKEKKTFKLEILFLSFFLLCCISNAQEDYDVMLDRLNKEYMKSLLFTDSNNNIMCRDEKTGEALNWYDFYLF
jgi:hypothetical protein